jgi:uncharacterized protein (TIGR01370 family)
MNIKRHWSSLLLSLFLAPAVCAQGIPSMQSTAVFYAPKPPVELLGKFRRVIVEADNLHADELKALHKQGAKVFAYLSIGEVSPSRQWYKQVAPDWILGRNRVWDSDVLDLTEAGWQDFIMEKLVRPLAEQGYDGLFLDTLDSFNLYVTSAEARQRQADALAGLLKNIRKTWPQMQLIANRGFEVMPEIAPLLEAVVAESLFASWDNARQKYQPADPAGQEWLLQRLQAIRKDYGLEVVIIDYLPPAHRDDARKLAGRIQELGFVPWVSTPELDSIGVGLIEPEAKTFLVVFDSLKDGQRPQELPAYQRAQADWQAKGYALEWHDVQSGLPATPVLRGRYAGVMTQLQEQQQGEAYRKWLQKQHDDGVSVRGLGGEGAL